MKLQRLFGCISVLHSKGDKSSAVVDMLLKNKAELDASGEVLGGTRMPQIDQCLILDRTVDFITPLLTPLTYEALIDEFLGIKLGTLKVRSFAVCIVARSLLRSFVRSVLWFGPFVVHLVSLVLFEGRQRLPRNLCALYMCVCGHRGR